MRIQLIGSDGDPSMTNARQPHHPRGITARFGLPAFIVKRTIVSDVVQGIIIGGVLAFITFKIVAHAYVTRVDGWTTMFGCSEPGNGILLRGACASEFPGPINVSQEAVYWTTKVDGVRAKSSREGTTTFCIFRRVVFRPTMHSGR